MNSKKRNNILLAALVGHVCDAGEKLFALARPSCLSLPAVQALSFKDSPLRPSKPNVYLYQSIYECSKPRAFFAFQGHEVKTPCLKWSSERVFSFRLLLLPLFLVSAVKAGTAGQKKRGR